MSKSYRIIEKSQMKSAGVGGGWWFVLEGKFGDMAPLSFVGQEGAVETSEGTLPIVVEDAQVRHGVMSVKLDGADGLIIARQALLTIGAPEVKPEKLN